MGNYYQCLGIQEMLPDLSIEGKYCTVIVPFDQELNFPTLPQFPDFPAWPDIPWAELNPETTRIAPETHNRVRKLRSLPLDYGRRESKSALAGQSMNLAICIPKACSTREAFDALILNSTAIGFKYEDDYCRLPNDKPWVVADYLAIVVFSTLGVLIILSTAYDLRHNIFLQRDPKTINKVLQSFSVYTNARRLIIYTPVPGAIECMDGIRSLAILWVMVGHTYSNQFSFRLANPIDVVNWMISFEALWITVAPITVDTFFMMSGLLVVYTTAGKLTRMNLLKNLHLFYLNRFLRMFPMLAAFVLLQASILNRITDGPFWETVAHNTNLCRVYWWATLLHIHNYANPGNLCLPHTWYLAIDFQLYILSPLVLFWLLGTRRRVSWVALTVTMVVALVPATIYNVINEFPGGPVSTSRTPDEQASYMQYYYINTLTRCSPFFVGMVFGYLMHLNRGKVVMIPKFSVVVLWLCAVVISSTVVASTYPILQFDWDNQTVDTIINSASRPAWAVAIGWLIFACVHGYGGPLNWVLSLRMWKLPSRLSYALYIVHYTMIFVANSTGIVPVHFTPFGILYRAFADLVMAFIVSYILTVAVDSPCSTLVKHFLVPKRQQKPPIVKNSNEEPVNGRINRAYISDETKAVIKL